MKTSNKQLNHILSQRETERKTCAQLHISLSKLHTVKDSPHTECHATKCWTVQNGFPNWS